MGKLEEAIDTERDRDSHPRLVRGWGYGYEPDPKEWRYHWWPTRLSREEAETECCRELSWLRKPLYVQEWEGVLDEYGEGRRKKIGEPISIPANSFIQPPKSSDNRTNPTGNPEPETGQPTP